MALKRKKAGFLTKIIILAILVYAAVSLLDLRTQIQTAEGEQALLAQQVEEQAAVNAELMNDIQNSFDPETMEEVARDRLNLVSPGEKIFYNVSN